jgi:endonuclease/exonuclease/phosphatase family metal-dependent hydrolase
VLENNGSISNKPPAAPRPRRWLWFLLPVLLLLIGFWLLNVSRPGAWPEGCPEGCATASSRNDGPMRILSLNMRHGFPRFQHLDARLQLITAEIARLDPDMVCLQEVPWHWGSAAQELAGRAEMNYIYLRANGNRRAILFEEGEAILSRFPLRDPVATALEPSAGFFEHRVALQATVSTPWGDLRVVSTHLTHGEPAINEAQAESLIAFVSGSSSVTPAVVAGDFNARQDSPQIGSLYAAGWIDTFRTAHPGEPGLTCCVDDLTDADQDLDRRIDYIFLIPGDGSFSIVDSRVVFDQALPGGDGPLWASDHAGLLAELVSLP